MLSWLLFLKRELEKVFPEQSAAIKKVNELIQKYQYMR